MGEYNINKVISLTFDESPEVRKQAAEFLSQTDDPAAIFALMELSFDKDIGVREFAKQKLDMKKQAEQEVMSFATIFETNSDKKESEDPNRVPLTSMETKEKILQPITKLFEKRLGVERATAVRNKMMPTIERIYLNVRNREKKENESGRKAMQEFLTSYLEVMSDLDQIGIVNNQQATMVKQVAAETEIVSAETEQKPPKEVFLAEELEEVGKSESFDGVSKEMTELDLQEKEEVQKEQEIQNLPDTFFKKAYEIMMISGGDETTMKQEMERMVADASREIALAFKLAKKKFKENKITNIGHIRDSMRNINTEPLVVKTVENIAYNKTKKVVAFLTRILVNDGVGNEGVVYLFDNKGTEVKPNMRIKVMKGTAKTFDFSKETAIILGKKGNVYIIL